MVKGGDHDFEITYPNGLKVAADAKCKFEVTASGGGEKIESI